MVQRILFILVLLAASHAAGATRWVPLQVATIQGAIDASSNGDSVIVVAGTYYEQLDFKGKAIYVGSELGRDSTFLVPTQHEVATVRFVNGEGRSSVLDGFTIKGSRDGWGILCNNSGPTIQNCDISYTQELGRNGHGIACGTSYALIRNNRIHHNAAYHGGGLYIVGDCVFGTDSLTVVNCDIYNNYSRQGSGLYCTGAGGLSIHHNLFRGNFGIKDYGTPYAVVGLFTTTGRFYNNTVIESGFGVSGGNSALFDIRNNIIAGQLEAGLTPGPATYDYNDIWNVGSFSDPGPNGVNADPMFTDPAAGNYSLAPGSPCIDAGDPDPAYNDSDGTRADIGAGLVTGMVHDPYWQCPYQGADGDVNQSGTVTSADIIFLVNYIFKSGQTPLPCEAIGDANCDGSVTTADILRIVNYIFGYANEGVRLKGGDPPCAICTMVQQGVWTCP